MLAHEIEQELALLGVAQVAQEGERPDPRQNGGAGGLHGARRRPRARRQHQRFPHLLRRRAVHRRPFEQRRAEERRQLAAAPAVPAHQVELLREGGRGELRADLLLGAGAGGEPVLHPGAAAGGEDPLVLLRAVPPARPLLLRDDARERGFDLRDRHRDRVALEDRRERALRVARGFGGQRRRLLQPPAQEMAGGKRHQVLPRRVDRHRDALLPLEVEAEQPELRVGFDDAPRAPARHREHPADVEREPRLDGLEGLERLARGRQGEVLEQFLQRGRVRPQPAQALHQAGPPLLTVPEPEADELDEEALAGLPRAIRKGLVRREFQQRRGQRLLAGRTHPLERLDEGGAVAHALLQTRHPELLDRRGVASGDQFVPPLDPAGVAHGR